MKEIWVAMLNFSTITTYRKSCCYCCMSTTQIYTNNVIRLTCMQHKYIWGSHESTSYNACYVLLHTKLIIINIMFLLGILSFTNIFNSFQFSFGIIFFETRFFLVSTTKADCGTFYNDANFNEK